MTDKPQTGIPIASIHTHFNIFRDVKGGKTGDVTLDEQIEAMKRFIRWHERQSAIGKELLRKLVAFQARAAPVPVDAVDPSVPDPGTPTTRVK